VRSSQPSSSELPARIEFRRVLANSLARWIKQRESGSIASRSAPANSMGHLPLFWERPMTEIITAEAISRRKALTLLGLATAAFAASSVVAAPDAEAQTVGMERRQGRRTGRQERRQTRRTGRTERRQERRQ
jgi:hypothetical protein